jgi:hypothetical protein
VLVRCMHKIYVKVRISIKNVVCGISILVIRVVHKALIQGNRAT